MFKFYNYKQINDIKVYIVALQESFFMVPRRTWVPLKYVPDFLSGMSLVKTEIGSINRHGSVPQDKT